jgi:hypothetical protein
VTVTATDTITIAGAEGQFASGLFSQTDTMASGDAGSIVVKAGRLALTNSARISTSSYGAG